MDPLKLALMMSTLMGFVAAWQAYRAMKLQDAHAKAMAEVMEWRGRYLPDIPPNMVPPLSINTVLLWQAQIVQTRKLAELGSNKHTHSWVICNIAGQTCCPCGAIKHD